MSRPNRPTGRSSTTLPLVLLGAALLLSALIGYWRLHPDRIRLPEPAIVRSRLRNILSRPFPNGARGLESLLTEADESLSLGYLDRAQAEIRRAAEAARSEHDHLRVLKRAFQAARRTGDYRELERLSEQAHTRIPGSRNLRRLAAYASLRSEHPDRALRLLSGRRVETERRKDSAAAALWAETALKSDILISTESSATEHLEGGELDILLRLEQVQDPGVLAEAGRRFGDDRLVLDAVLLAMKRGDVALADEIGRAGLPEDSEAGFWVAYDAGRFEEARGRLEKVIERRSGPRYDLRALRADLQVMTDHPDRAEEGYLELVLEAPGFSWKPLLNLAALLEGRGDAEGALHYRRLAAERHPGQRPVLLALARDLRLREEGGELAKTTEEAARLFPGDPEVSLLVFELEAAALTPGQYRMGLWKLINRFPADETLSRRAVAYLLETGDLDGARSALRLQARASGESRSPWQLYALGVLASLSGRYEQSAGLFGECLQSGERWWVLYARGLALAAGGRIGAAMEDVRRAEARLENLGNGEALRSRMRSRQGLLLLANGDTAAARRELRYARELDPGNLKAALLLKKLEEEWEK